MMRRLLLVHDGRRVPLRARHSLSREDVELFLVCGSSEAGEGVRAHRTVVTDTRDATALRAAVEQFQVAFDGVGTIVEPCVLATARLARDMGLRGPRVEAVARTSVDKLAMRAALRQGGINAPRFRVLEGLRRADLAEALAEFGALVIKPAAGENSIGVLKVSQGADLEGTVIPTLHAAVAAAARAIIHIDATHWVAEEYVPGTMVSVDGFVQGGTPHVVGLVETELGPEPYFTMQANYLPSRLSREKEAVCRALATSALGVLGLDDCAFHCELRVGETEAYVIEVASRLPGGQIPAAYARARGIDVFAAQVDLWLGQVPDLRPQSRIQVYQKGVFPDRPGVIQSVRGFEEAHSLPGVWDFIGLAREGASVVTYPAMPVPYYYYAVEGLWLDDVMHLARQVEASIEVSVA